MKGTEETCFPVIFYDFGTELESEWLELEGTCKGHLVQLPCNEQGHLQLHQVLRAPSV